MTTASEVEVSRNKPTSLCGTGQDALLCYFLYLFLWGLLISSLFLSTKSPTVWNVHHGRGWCGRFEVDLIRIGFSEKRPIFAQSWPVTSLVSSRVWRTVGSVLNANKNAPLSWVRKWIWRCGDRRKTDVDNGNCTGAASCTVRYEMSVFASILSFQWYTKIKNMSLGQKPQWPF